MAHGIPEVIRREQKGVELVIATEEPLGPLKRFDKIRLQGPGLVFLLEN